MYEGKCWGFACSLQAFNWRKFILPAAADPRPSATARHCACVHCARTVGTVLGNKAEASSAPPPASERKEILHRMATRQDGYGKITILKKMDGER